MLKKSGTYEDQNPSSVSDAKTEPVRRRDPDCPGSEASLVGVLVCVAVIVPDEVPELATSAELELASLVWVLVCVAVIVPDEVAELALSAELELAVAVPCV